MENDKKRNKPNKQIKLDN